MADDEMAGLARRQPAEDAQANEHAQIIEMLMSQPPARRPAITVVGDDNVFAINPLPPFR